MMDAGDDFTLRAATRADARAIAEVHVHAWQWAYRGLMPEAYLDGLSVEVREATWHRMLSDVPCKARVWLVEVRGVVVGFSAAGPSRDMDAPSTTGELYAIYLERGALGFGIGRQLLLRAVTDLRESGYLTAMLWVLEPNERARRLYDAAGWSSDGGAKSERIGSYVVREVRYRLDLRQL